MGVKIDGKPISALSIDDLKKGSTNKKTKIKMARELKKREQDDKL